MRKPLLILLASVLALVGWSAVSAEDGFYVVPVIKNSPPVVLNAPVPKTGQTQQYGAGDDGALQKGVPSPTPRFTDNGNGTVTDNLTGLIWMKNANVFGMRLWAEALMDANGLQAGYFGLTDGSKPGDWRLPNDRELHSLVDYGINSDGFALPPGHPFINVQASYDDFKVYWSSTTYNKNNELAWFVNFYDGRTLARSKGTNCYVWCVRGGQ
jgi:hypothetical protein